MGVFMHRQVSMAKLQSGEEKCGREFLLIFFKGNFFMQIQLHKIDQIHKYDHSYLLLFGVYKLSFFFFFACFLLSFYLFLIPSSNLLFSLSSPFLPPAFPLSLLASLFPFSFPSISFFHFLGFLLPLSFPSPFFSLPFSSPLPF